MRYIELIEAPIEDVTVHQNISGSDQERARYSNNDARYLNNPENIKKLKGSWGKINIPFYINIIQSPMNEPFKSKLINPGQLNSFNDRYKLDIKYHPEAINIIFSNNRTFGGKGIPFTKWMLAHRMMEILYYSNHPSNYNYNRNEGEDELVKMYRTHNRELEDHIKKGLTGILKNTGMGSSTWSLYKLFTMASARNYDPTFDQDIIQELFAQYIVTGNIKFNDASVLNDEVSDLWHPELDNARAVMKSMKKEKPLSQQKINEVNEFMEDFKTLCIKKFDELLEWMKGKILTF